MEFAHIISLIPRLGTNLHITLYSEIINTYTQPQVQTPNSPTAYVCSFIHQSYMRQLLKEGACMFAE